MEDIAKPKTTPRDFFLYLGAMATLYISAVSLVMLLFEYIDALYPDPLQGYIDMYSSSMRFAIASLIVVFPLYVALTKKLNHDLRAHPEKKEIRVRKWLIYLTLFIGGAVLAGDLIALINTFLGGELTTRFVLKVLVVLIVVGGAFKYYYFDLKGKWEQEPNMARMVGWVALAFVCASIVAGFFVIGSPQTQRLMRFDQVRLSDLQNIQYQIVNYWQLKERLPATLAEMEDPLTGFIVPKDPSTNESYVYRATAPLTFELCATFKTESRGDAKSTVPYPVMNGFENENWKHGIGEACFSRTIDPERFPPNTKTEGPSRVPSKM